MSKPVAPSGRGGTEKFESVGLTNVVDSPDGILSTDHFNCVGYAHMFKFLHFIFLEGETN